MSQRNLKIEDWQGTPASHLPGSRRTQWLPNTRVIGITGTLLLHLVVCQSVIFGTRAHKFRPTESQGLSAAHRESENTPLETLILVQLPGASVSDRPLSLDNRRLLAFSLAGREVPYIWATSEEIAGETWKFTATPEQLGGWFIRVGK